MRRKNSRNAWIKGIVLTLFLFGALSVRAQAPAWWHVRGVVYTNSFAEDFAPLVLGQLKWMATNACLEIEEHVAGGAGTSVWSLVQGFSAATNNSVSVNVGQLKAVGDPFYDRLIQIGYATDYPWTSSTNDDADYAIANIGQLKHAFSFDVTREGDTDSDGMADWLELKWWGSVTGGVASADDDYDGMANAWEATNGLCPVAGLSAGLVGWWEMDEDTGPTVYDASGYGNDGTGYLSPWICSEGFPVGGAHNFDGTNDSVVIPHDDSLAPTSGLTVAAWLRLEPVGGIVLSKMEADQGTGGFAVITSGDGSIYFWTDAGWVAGYAVLGVWNHIAAVFDGSNTLLYINGDLVASSSGGGAINTGTNDISIGGDDIWGRFAGRIADVRMYDIALTGASISNMVECLADYDSDGLGNLEEYQRACSPRDPDTDNDGSEDGHEVAIGTDPTDSASFPATISGTISSSSSQTGTVRIAACTASNDWSSAFTVNLASAGAYTISNVPTLSNYWLKAYCDTNNNGSIEFGEAYGCYVSNPLALSDSATSKDITLEDGDFDEDGLPDWWELQWFGGADQSGWSDFDGDGTANLFEYLAGTDPTVKLSVTLCGTNAQIAWSQPSVTGITSYAYSLYTNTLTNVFLVGGTNLFGSDTTTNLYLSGLATGAEYRLVLRSNGTGWTNSVAWLQIDTNTVASDVIVNAFEFHEWRPEGFPFISNSCSVIRREGWDGYFLSSLPTGPRGWNAQNLSVKVGTTVFSLPADDSLDITDALPTGQTAVALQVIASCGTNSFILDKQIYLLKWAPTAVVAWEDSEGGQSMKQEDGILAKTSEGETMLLGESSRFVVPVGQSRDFTVTLGVPAPHLGSLTRLGFFRVTPSGSANPVYADLYYGITQLVSVSSSVASGETNGHSFRVEPFDSIEPSAEQPFTVFGVSVGSANMYVLCGTNGGINYPWNQSVGVDVSPHYLLGALDVSVGGVHIYHANAYWGDYAVTAVGSPVEAEFTVDGLTASDSEWLGYTYIHKSLTSSSTVLANGTTLTAGLQSYYPQFSPTGVFTLAWTTPDSNRTVQLVEPGFTNSSPVEWTNTNKTFSILTSGAWEPGDQATFTLGHNFCNCNVEKVLTVPKVELTNVTFSASAGNYFPVRKDDDSADYDGPHWQDNNLDGDADDPGEHKYPVAYTQNTKAKVEAKFKVQPVPSGVTIRVKGDGPGNLDIPETEASISGDIISMSATEMSGAFTNAVDYLNPQTINWQVSFDGGARWCAAGKSENEVFVVMGTPGCAKLFRTVMYLACKNTGGTEAGSCLTNTWTSFSGPANVCAWDETAKSYSRHLHYYETPSGHSNTSTTELLADADGQCHAWAHFLKECLLVNNVGSQRTRVNPPAGYYEFFVRNVAFDDVNPTYPADDPWKYDESDLDGDPPPAGAEGIPGQNMTTPAAKRFERHFIVLPTGSSIYYDPSYGTTAASEGNYTTNSIDAWEDWISGAYHWRKTSSAPSVNLQFSLEAWPW